MAGKALKKSGKDRSIKNQFVLTVGDEGAILAHYNRGRLENRLYVDSPYAEEVKLMQKLVSAYPKTPISMLVDVIEQNYMQQALPPVSKMAVKKQVDRRIEKEFQPDDMNNYLSLGRSKEGRKDWNILLVSLANSDPFAKWLEFALNQKNDFKGVYLLPIESQMMIADLSKVTGKLSSGWELLLLDNKVGGFRIIALYDGQLVFTRLAQQLAGNNVPDVIVGNMEQEISNTVEYLKRLGFKSEGDAKITIIAGALILKRIDKKSLKFGEVELYTPFEVGEKLRLQNCIDDQDKFADIVTTSYFAAQSKHLLKFESPYTKTLSSIKSATSALLLLGVAAVLGMLFMFFLEYEQISSLDNNREQLQLELNKTSQTFLLAKKKHDALPENVDKMLDVLYLNKSLPKDEDLVLQVFVDIGMQFGEGKEIVSVGVKFGEPVKAAQKKSIKVGKGSSSEGIQASEFVYPFEAEYSFQYSFYENELDVINDITYEFLLVMEEKFPDYTFSYSEKPVSPKSGALESISSGKENQGKGRLLKLKSGIKVLGEL